MVSVVQESVRQKEEEDTGKCIWRGGEVNAGTDWEREGWIQDLKE